MLAIIFFETFFQTYKHLVRQDRHVSFRRFPYNIPGNKATDKQEKEFFCKVKLSYLYSHNHSNPCNLYPTRLNYIVAYQYPSWFTKHIRSHTGEGCVTLCSLLLIISKLKSLVYYVLLDLTLFWFTLSIFNSIRFI